MSDSNRLVVDEFAHVLHEQLLGGLRREARLVADCVTDAPHSCSTIDVALERRDRGEALQVPGQRFAVVQLDRQAKTFTKRPARSVKLAAFHLHDADGRERFETVASSPVRETCS